MKNLSYDFGQTYLKVLKVIESCTSLDQIKGAENYLANFCRVYSYNISDNLSIALRNKVSEKVASLS